jgi:hypothetical protein
MPQMPQHPQHHNNSYNQPKGDTMNKNTEQHMLTDTLNYLYTRYHRHNRNFSFKTSKLCLDHNPSHLTQIIKKYLMGKQVKLINPGRKAHSYVFKTQIQNTSPKNESSVNEKMEVKKK